MESKQAARPPGRPKGSKNKKANLSGATVERICEFHKFNPAEKLIAIAQGEDDQPWPLAIRYQAIQKLHDSIHNKKHLPGGEGLDGDGLGQYEIVFIEGDTGFVIPGTPDAESIAGTVPAEPVQCASDTPQGWEDSLRDKQTNTGRTDLHTP
jgi:hypothetical protein